MGRVLQDTRRGKETAHCVVNRMCKRPFWGGEIAFREPSVFLLFTNYPTEIFFRRLAIGFFFCGLPYSKQRPRRPRMIRMFAVLKLMLYPTSIFFLYGNKPVCSLACRLKVLFSSCFLIRRNKSPDILSRIKHSGNSWKVLWCSTLECTT